MLLGSVVFPALPAYSADTTRAAKIVDFFGEVKIKKAGGEKTFSAFKGMGLTQGDGINTDKGAWVILELDGDKEIKIAEKTQITINEFLQSDNGVESSSFQLRSGEIWSNIKNELSPGSKYEIRTPTAVMGVRGTRFSTNYQEGKIQVNVISGKVVVNLSIMVTHPDGTEDWEQAEVELDPNKVFSWDVNAENLADYKVEELSLDKLDLFTLEILSDLANEEPDSLWGLLESDLESLIEQRQDERRQVDESSNTTSSPQITYDPGIVPSSSDGGGGDSTPAMTVESVSAITDINVVHGTILEEIGLPSTVEVKLSNNTTTQKAVAWDEGSPAYSVNVAGEYVFTGDVADTDLTATVKVTVASLGQVVVPIANQESGTYSTTLNVELSSVTEGATIWYTRDGSDPRNSETRNMYEGEITVSETTTIKAYAEKEEMDDSDIVVFQYNIEQLSGENDAEAILAAAYDPENKSYLLVFEKNIDDEKAIYGRLLDESTQAIVPEFAISPDTNTSIGKPRVEYDLYNEKYLVIWEEKREAKFNIFGQVINSDGTLQGESFAISADSDHDQKNPSLAYNNFGREFLVVWDNQNEKIEGSFIDLADPTQTETFDITDIPGKQMLPDVAYTGEGGVNLIVFVNYVGNTYDICAQTYMINWDETIISDFITIAQGPAVNAGFVPQPVVASYPGDFLVVWEEGTNGNYDIVGQCISHSGTLDGSKFTITSASGSQIRPAINVGDMYLVSWQDDRNADETDQDIYGVFIDIDEGLNGSEIAICTEPGKQFSSAVTFNSNSYDYLVSYQNEANPSTIGIKLSNPLTSLQQVNQPTWEGDVIKWEDVTDAISYKVKLYKDTSELVDTQIVDPGEEQYNFTSKIAEGAGSYTVTVQAIGDDINYSDGPVSAVSEANEKEDMNLEMQFQPLAAGFSHSLVVRDGKVWFMGSARFASSNVPMEIAGLTDVAAVAAGDNFSVALKTDGTVWTWGENYAGQLGKGDTVDAANPIEVNGLTDVKAIALGTDHVVALKGDGTVWTWGDNSAGQLGQGEYESKSTVPLQVKNSDGNGHLTDILMVAAGSYHSIALKSDGTVWSWGDNSTLQLGIGDNIDHNLPVQVSNETGDSFLTEVDFIAAGTYHNAAIIDGAVWTWGNNWYGQLGDGTTTSKARPVPVVGIEDIDKPIKSVAIGSVYSGHTLAITNMGKVLAWGDNSYGQLGDGTIIQRITPVTINLTSITAIAAGGENDAHSLAIKSDASVWGWGWNGSGQLGSNADSNENELPVGITFIDPNKSLAPSVDDINITNNAVGDDEVIVKAPMDTDDSVDYDYSS